MYTGDVSSGQTYYTSSTISPEMRVAPTAVLSNINTQRFATIGYQSNTQAFRIYSVCNSSGARGIFECEYTLDAEL